MKIDEDMIRVAKEDIKKCTYCLARVGFDKSYVIELIEAEYKRYDDLVVKEIEKAITYSELQKEKKKRYSL